MKYLSKLPMKTLDFFKRGGLFKDAVFKLLMLLLVLLPIAFSTSGLLTMQFAKLFVFTGLVVISSVLFLLSVIREGGVILPRSIVFYSALSLLGVLSISALFADPSIVSFVGFGFEVTTVAILFLMMVLMYLVSVSFNSSVKIVSSFGFVVITFVVLALYQIIRFVAGADFLSFGVFNNIISNPVGGWNDLAILAGLVAIICLTTLEYLELRLTHKIFVWVAMAMSVFLLISVNFQVLWYLLGFVSLVFFVQQAAAGVHARLAVVSGGEQGSETRLESAKRKIAVKTLVFGLVSVFFILPIGADLARGVVDLVGVNNIEVRPSWLATTEIFRETIKESPVLGPGPNTFGKQWQKHRPDINQSNFWNADFDRGIGVIPTSLVETGLLGVMAWLAFMFSIVYVGFRVSNSRSTDRVSRFVASTASISVLFLWLTLVFYNPNIVIVGLTFFFTGILIAVARHTGVVSFAQFNFARSQGFSFFANLVVVLVIILLVGLGYVLFERGRSSIHFQRGLIAASAGDFNSVYSNLNSASRLANLDIYHRTLSDMAIGRMNVLLTTVANRPQANESEVAEFQSLVSVAIQSATMARDTDPNNFLNHQVMASVYENLTRMQVEGAYDLARSSYDEALKLSPRNPALYLSLARLEANNNNLSLAEENIVKAIELKSNYIDAIFLKSQLDVMKGDTVSAIRTAEQAVLVAPNEPLSYFQLGLLKYETRDYLGAAEAFEGAISFVPVYANARYYLGLSYSRLGRRSEAIAEFENIKQTNPGNQAIEQILENLRNGRDPLYRSESNDPSSVDDLPLSEEI